MCGLTVLIINLMSGLIYFDLTENEHLVSINKDLQILTFIRDLSILSFLRLIMLMTLFHGRIMGSEDSAGSIANIWMNINSDSLDYYSIMLQDHIN